MGQTRYQRAMQLIAEGHTNAQAAAEVGVHEITISKWRGMQRQLDAKGEESEMETLRRQLATVTEERDWLRSVVTEYIAHRKQEEVTP